MSEAGMDAAELFTAICERIPDAMTRQKVPGVAFGLTCDGLDFARGFGVTSVSHPLPVDENTLFQIGSTTKTFTATALMRLVEAGKLDLDAPLRTYMPDFTMKDPDVTARVTTRHLLTHTGGWEGDWFEDTGDGDDALAKYVKFMSKLPQLSPLGALLSYNNAAFSLAGRVIEVLTGKTYEAALKELVLRPLGLKRSLLFPTHVMLHSFAVGHATVADKTIVLRPWQITRAGHAAGGIAASMIDQLRYARFHLGDGTGEDGTRVLAPETIAAMQTPGVVGELDYRMGLAWRIQGDGDSRFVYHGGGTWGQISAFNMAPRRKFAFAVMTNSNSGGLVARDAVRDLLRQFLSIDEPEPDEIAMSATQMAEYAGRYEQLLGDVELKVEDGKLMFHVIPKGGFPTRDIPPGPPPPPFRVGLVALDRIAMLEPATKDVQGEFLRSPDGKIAFLRWGARIHVRK
jgi:CubicO group peptidase (beta-lactamase class C family)